jgi:hypothetical protein
VYTTRVSPVGIPLDIYRICFIVCTTRVSPVGIPRDIYRICFIVCTTRVSPVGIPLDIYRICFILCTTRVSPVGIPRNIYMICFYINVCMYVYLHNCLFSFEEEPWDWGVVTAGHLAIVAVACGRCRWLGWTLLWCLCDAALFGWVWVFGRPQVWLWWICCSLSGGEELFVIPFLGSCVMCIRDVRCRDIIITELRGGSYARCKRC